MPTRPPLGRLVDVTLDGRTRTVHVREDGPADAPAVVLLHGFCGSLQWFDLVVPRLSGDFRIVRVDLLGHGSTGGAGADAPGQARVIDAALADVGVTDATIVGHSFGADVAVELAERSARVIRLVILAQAPDYTDAQLPRAGELVGKPWAMSLVRWFAQPLAGLLGRGAVRLRTGGTTRVLMVQGLRDFSAMDPAMFRVVLTERGDRMATRPLDEQVRTAAKPTLVVLGGRDHFYGARSEARYAAAGARVEVLPQAGHSIQVEQPDRVADLVREFAGART